MNCPKCGAENIIGSTFCIKCGTNIKEYSQQNNNQNINGVAGSINVQSIPTQPVMPQNIVEQPIEQVQQSYVQQPMQQTVQSISSQSQQSSINTPLNYLMYMIAILLRPFKSFKEEESKLTNTKTSLIFATIVSISMMLITLVKTMITTICTKSLDYSTFKMKTSFEFSNLKDLDWLSLIGKNLLIYAGIIFAIAIVYYLASLVFKKAVSFIKLLSIATTSLIPFIVLVMIVSPIIGKIWYPLSIIAMVAGAIYSIIVFINLIDDSISFEDKDKKIYFHLICLSILGIAGYYLYMKIILASVTSQINVDSIMNLFN